MYRLIFIILILLSVLSIGIPIPNPLSSVVFEPLRLLGIDVSMTPITSDMSMMTDAQKVPLYKKNLIVKIFFSNGKSMDLNPQRLDLYFHKLPIILFYEIYFLGTDMPEGRDYLCRTLGDLIGRKISGFLVGERYQNDHHFVEEIQRCL